MIPFEKAVKKLNETGVDPMILDFEDEVVDPTHAVLQALILWKGKYKDRLDEEQNKQLLTLEKNLRALLSDAEDVDSSLLPSGDVLGKETE